MLNDAERRTLAAIEHRIVDEDPVLSLLARRLSAEAQRREPHARQAAPGRVPARPQQPRVLPLMVVLTAAVTAAVVGGALGRWVVAFLGIVAIAVAARQFAQVVRRA